MKAVEGNSKTAPFGRIGESAGVGQPTKRFVLLCHYSISEYGRHRATFAISTVLAQLVACATKRRVQRCLHFTQALTGPGLRDRSVGRTRQGQPPGPLEVKQGNPRHFPEWLPTSVVDASPSPGRRGVVTWRAL